MAKEIVWTSRASDDLHQIFEYLYSYSDDRAEAVVGEIIDKAALLENFPQMGRVVPEINLKTIREIIIHQYRIVYVVGAQAQIEILTVRHSARPLSDFSP
jgi:addiction module RelE/StbE family toxin